MAGDNLKSIRDILTCPVCLELFNDPYILPCSHVLCRSCIEGVVQNKTSFNCPECRRNVVLDRTGIDCLERDRRTALMVEAAERATNRQTVKREMKTDKCEKHNRPEEIYCKTYNILVCNKCGFDGSHDGHPMFEAEQAADKGKQWINLMIDQVSEYHNEAQKQINECEAHTSSIKAEASRLWHVMEETFEKIKSDLLKREEELNKWLQKQIEYCESINRTFIVAVKEDAERLNSFILELQNKLKEESISFVKSFGPTKKRVLDFLEKERSRTNPQCFPGDALSTIEFKYAPWRVSWPGNVEDITLIGSIKYLKETVQTRQPTTNMQTTILEIDEIHRRLLSKSKSVRTALEKDLQKYNATVEWPFDFKEHIKVISELKETRKNFNKDIRKRVGTFMNQFKVREIDFKEIGFKWIQWRIEYIEKEMRNLGDSFVLIWTAQDVTVIGVAAKLDQLVRKLKSLMAEK